MNEIGLEPRSCELCDSREAHLMWSGEGIVARAKDTWKFPYNISVCKKCGFCFSSPGPKEDDLRNYYADGLTGYKNIGLPYSIEDRIRVLQRFSVPDGVLVEIGGDEPGEFHRRCAPLFRRQIAVEVSDETGASHRGIEELPESAADVLVHYDVLEHVVGVRRFLESCQSRMKPGGVMICEVPDLRLYPRNLLVLEFEHVNHFSAHSLTALAARAGFNLIEIEHHCSRPWGLLCIFRKEAVFRTDGYGRDSEYLDAIACVQGGIRQVEQNQQKIESCRRRIQDFGSDRKKTTLWGVTDQLRKLIDGVGLPDGCVVVDSDPRRRDHLESSGIVVRLPEECIDHLAESELIVICAPRYQREISNWISVKTGNMFSRDKVTVLGTGPSGETLL
jgi:hypothetical protein